MVARPDDMMRRVPPHFDAADLDDALGLVVVIPGDERINRRATVNAEITRSRPPVS